MTLVEAIARASGITEGKAHKSNIKIIRKDGDQRIACYVVNLNNILNGKTKDFPLQNRDIIYIPLAPLAKWRLYTSYILGFPIEGVEAYREIDWAVEDD